MAPGAKVEGPKLPPGRLIRLGFAAAALLLLCAPFGVRAAEIDDEEAAFLRAIAGEPPASLTPPAQLTPDDAPASAPEPLPPAASSPPPQPAATNTTPRVAIRVGDHDGFSRVVFEWPAAVEYKVESKGDSITIRFARPAEIDLAPIRKDPPKTIAAASTRIDGDATLVELRLRGPGKTHHYRSGGTIVVDAIAEGPKPLSVMNVPAPKPPAAAAPKAKAVTAKTEPVPKLPATPPAALSPVEVQAAVAPAAPATAPPKGLVPADAGVPAQAAPAPIAPAAAAETPATPAAQPANAADAAPLTPIFLGDGVNTTIVFPWMEPVAAAGFFRGGYFWLVFDRDSVIQWPHGDPIMVRFGLEQVDHAAASVVRLRLAGSQTPSMNRRGLGWALTVTEAPAATASSADPDPPPPAAKPIELTLRARPPQGIKAMLLATAAGQPISLDGADGGRLTVVPVGEAQRGFAARRDFVQFAVLPSLQGIVVQPKSDDLRVATERDGVSIDAASGLLLSGINERERTGLLRFNEWRRGGRDGYVAAKQKLQAALAQAAPEDRDPARFDLAQFYFAHGMLPESLAVLGHLAQGDPELEQAVNYRVLWSVANLRLGRLDETLSLTHSSLDGYPEIGLWRGALAAARGQWDRAKAAFAVGLNSISGYPPDVRAELRLAMARMWIELKDTASARAELNALASEGANPPEVLLLRARVAILEGAAADAKQLHELAAQSAHRGVRAAGELALMESDLAANKIDVPQAIAKLERLRFVWRGDELEFRIMRRLADLHLATQDYRNGFDTMRQAITYYPEAAETAGLPQRLRETFVELFNGGGAQRLSPLKAIGLYQDYRDLTPAGPVGDAIIEHLADRLVEADLLDRAAYLLEHLMRQRLSGIDKARAGARLAVIYLIDRKPEVALEALRVSGAVAMPLELIADRRRLEVRALADMGRYTEALALLGDDHAFDAHKIRTDIHWRARHWREAADGFAALLGDRWKQREELSAEERTLVLKLALSLALAGDRAGLDEARKRYAGRLDGTAEANAFGLVTSKVEKPHGTYRETLDAIAQIDQLETFMANYRQKLAGKPAKAAP
jgi:hypothetical protein